MCLRRDNVVTGLPPGTMRRRVTTRRHRTLVAACRCLPHTVEELVARRLSAGQNQHAASRSLPARAAYVLGRVRPAGCPAFDHPRSSGIRLAGTARSPLLRDAVSGADSGRVLYDANHQSTTYTEPNWTDDERFNKTIQCGAKNGAGEQKDTLQLADVDYGHSGAWSLSVWFRHDPEDFDGKEREQFIGHGDAREANGNPNHSTCRWRTPRVPHRV